MVSYIRVFVGVNAVAFACLTFAQANLGELLDKGATKISKEAWLSQLPVSFGGIDFTDRVDFKFEFTSNGKFTGNANSTRGAGSSGSFGTWTMEESGKQCIDEKLTAWNMKWDECYFVYKLDNQYFSTQSDSDRGSRAMVRKMTSVK
jgi:hypothetical protein